jgi:tetratricopeptide (TPR) repeat protein
MKRKRKRVTLAPSPAPSPAAAPASVSRIDAWDSQRHYFAAALALGLLTLLAFSSSFSTGFALDNQMLLLGDARIRTANAANTALIIQHTYWWPNGESGLYRPLTTLSYLFNYSILGNGDRPAGYHWINFFLHTANVFLLFALVLRLMTGRVRALPAAFFIAMLWAVHPVLTESVTNIVGRADLLAGFAVLSGFLLYLKSAETTGWRRGAWLAGLAAITAVGVFSKESAVVLPAIIGLYELACGKRWRSMFAGCLATLAPIGIMLWQRTAVLSSTLPAEYPFVDNPIASAGAWVGRLTAIKVLALYLWVALWPMKLSADYSYSQITLAHGSLEDWVCWLAVAAAVALTVVFWNRSRLAFFFAGFAFLNLLPASNLLFPIGAIMAERFLYLPLAGLMAALIIAMHAAMGEATARFGFSRAAFAICVAVVAAGFAVRTWVRNLDWTDSGTIARASVQTGPRSFKVHRLLAAVLLDADPSHRDIDGAVAEADRSIAILAPLPDDLDLPGPWNLAAVCHRAKGDALSPGTPISNDARAQYEEAVRLALRSIAIDRASRGAYDLRHGVKSPVPASAADGYRTLASAYLHLGRAPEALAAASAAQTIDPSNAGVYDEIADAYFAQQRGEDAAIALAEGAFLTGDRNLRDELLKLYQSGVDPQGCAVVQGPHGPTLNPSCEIVRRDLCEAALRGRLPDVRRRLGCPN